MNMKRLFKILFYIFVGLILALFLAPILFEDKLKEAIKDAIEKRVDAQVEFDDISMSFFSDLHCPNDRYPYPYSRGSGCCATNVGINHHSCEDGINCPQGHNKCLFSYYDSVGKTTVRPTCIY